LRIAEHYREAKIGSPDCSTYLSQIYQDENHNNIYDNSQQGPNEHGILSDQQWIVHDERRNLNDLANGVQNNQGNCFNDQNDPAYGTITSRVCTNVVDGVGVVAAESDAAPTSYESFADESASSANEIDCECHECRRHVQDFLRFITEDFDNVFGLQD